MKNREESNSITHLVKIVAAEVVEEKLEEYGLLPVQPDWKKTRAGEAWTSKEDEALATAVRDFICEMAKKHQRTYGAIVARIDLKTLWR